MRVAFISAIIAGAIPTIVTATYIPDTFRASSALERRVTTSDNVFLYPGGLGAPLNAALAAITPKKTQGINFDKFINNQIPNRCKISSLTPLNGAPGCTMANMQVVDYGWEDAPGRLWTICRCTDSPVSWTQIGEELGRIPVALRQRTRNFMFFKAGGPYGAYAWYTDVTFFGNITPTIVIHETSHNFASANGFDSGTTWTNAIASDTCWADYYAKSSPAEAWAQINVLVQYKYGTGTTLLRPLPTAQFGSGLTETCLWTQFWTVLYQSYTEMSAGYDASKAPAADTIVLK